MGQLNVNPVLYDSLDEVFRVLRSNEIDGAVMDRYPAGYLLRDTERFGDLKLTRKFPIRKIVYIYVFHDKLKTGLQFNQNAQKDFADRTHAVIRRFVPPYSVTKYYVRSITELFDVKQDGRLDLGFKLSGLFFMMVAVYSQFCSKFVLEKAGKTMKLKR